MWLPTIFYVFFNYFFVVKEKNNNCNYPGFSENDPIKKNRYIYGETRIPSFR